MRHGTPLLEESRLDYSSVPNDAFCKKIGSYPGLQRQDNLYSENRGKESPVSLQNLPIVQLNPRNFMNKAIQVGLKKILVNKSCITDHHSVFKYSQLQMKFELINKNMSSHFKEKLTVISAKSRSDYMVVQENNGFSLLSDGNVVTQLSGKLQTNLS